MKCLPTMNVKTDDLSRGKRRIVVFTGRQKRFNSNKETDKEQVASSNHITIHECDNSNSKIKLAKTRETLEDRGQATIDD